jgi:allantoinase
VRRRVLHPYVREAWIAYDLIVRGGTLELPTGETVGDLAVEDGVIAAIGRDLEGNTRSEMPARGLHVLPGCIDVHVHLNEPGRADWEGVDSGTQALAAGGVTTFCDMPLNAIPPTIDAAAFDAKRTAYHDRAWVDYAFWGGLVPGGTNLEELRERGVVGVKAFMASSNTPEFPRVDDLTLLEGMDQCAKLGMIVAVHAENAEITDRLGGRARGTGATSAAEFLASRPAIAEVEAITRAITMAQETSCSLHIVHVSTEDGINLVSRARERGVDVTCETCPHYLAFTGEDVDRLGVSAKCQPPLRTPADQRALWKFLDDDADAMVASDHSPAPAGMRLDGDFVNSWGGIAGAQTTLMTLLTRWSTGEIGASDVVRVFACNPARRFGFADRGQLQVGYRADIVICDRTAPRPFTPERSRSRDASSPFIGRTFEAEVLRTIVAGRMVWSDGTTVGRPTGRLVQPERPQP